MRAPRRLVLGLASVLGAASLAPAQAVRRIPATVTFVAGRTLYLDKGRELGIEPGDTVVVSPPGNPTVEGRIVAIAAQSCSAELATAVAGLGLGAPAEILVPLARRPDAAKPAPPTSGPSRPTRVVEHPPWTRPLDPQASPDLPLLAPTYGKARPRDPMRLRGRAYTNLLHTADSGGDRDSRYVLGRAGVDLSVENPADFAGRLRFSGEGAYRAVELEDAPDTDDTSARIDRFSYRRGDGRSDRWRFEVGRFLQDEVPELGLLDGVEVSHLTESLGRFGASFGAMPAPYPDLASGDDLQLALHHRLALGEHDEFAQTLALQKTWHEGKSDRDLLLWNLEAHPGGPFSFRTSTWIDFYGSRDVAKGSGPELTHFQGQAQCQLGTDTGLAALLTYLRWPEMLRSEFASLPAERLREARLVRFGPSLWHRFDEHWRLDARADFWEDERDSGLGGEVRVAARDVLLARHELSVTAFALSGSYLSGPGLRVWSMHSFQTASLRLGYEFGHYEAENLTTGGETITQHALLAGWDWHFADAWDLSLHADSRFGDGAGSTTLGLYVQTRF